MLWAFGLSNCKTHALPDYVKTIREFGTMDGYSTQNMSSLFKVKFWVEVNWLFCAQGELEHCRCKWFYPQVHKGKFAPGMAWEVHHEHILQIKAKNHSLVVTCPPQKKKKTISCKSFSIPFSQSEPLPCANPDQHYQMSNETHHPHDITRMLGEHYGDPALEVCTLLFLKIVQRSLTAFCQNFILNLKDYALCKVLGLEHDADEINFTESQWASIIFIKNKIYQLHNLQHAERTRLSQSPHTCKHHGPFTRRWCECPPLLVCLHYWHISHLRSPWELPRSHPNRIPVDPLVWARPRSLKSLWLEDL